MSAEDFAGFLARVRAGDEQAAADLARRYEPIIRREVRLRLTSPSVCRLLDDEDICQSVLKSFFVRVSLGQYDLHDAAQLRQLLLRMARNKLFRAIRHQNTQKAGGGQNALAPVDDLDPAGNERSPSSIVAWCELLEQVRQRLNDEERAVADLRGQGHDWAEIARQLGGTPDGRRMQLARALKRVSGELPLEDADD